LIGRRHASKTARLGVCQRLAHVRQALACVSLDRPCNGFNIHVLQIRQFHDIAPFAALLISLAFIVSRSFLAYIVSKTDQDLRKTTAPP
jgi:hypothetical protein